MTFEVYLYFMTKKTMRAKKTENKYIFIFSSELQLSAFQRDQSFSPHFKEVLKKHDSYRYLGKRIIPKKNPPFRKTSNFTGKNLFAAIKG